MRCIWNIAMMLLASYSLSATSVGDVSKLEGVTFSKINPVDSSLWVVTSDRGLLRLGRNLKAFTYKFPGDSVLVLDFDSAGVPWFLDSKGDYYSYSSYQGFVRGNAPAEVVGKLTAAPDEEIVPPVQDEEKLESKASGSFPWWLVVLAVLGCALFFWIGRRSSGKAAVAEPAPLAPVKPSEPAPASVNAPSPAPTPAPVRASKPASAETAKTEQAPVDAAPVLENVTKDEVSKAYLQSFYNQVLDFVNSNYSNPDFSVEDVAAHFGMSRVHLNRKLKACAQDSPSAMIKAARMKLASEMLESGKYSIVEVAQKCGFSSAAYFSTAFKEYFGKSPSSMLQ